MRAIKFRGKRVDNGEWVYGYYVKARSHHYILPFYNKDNFDDLSDAQEFFNHHIPDNKKLILILEEDYIVSKKLCYAYDEPRFLFPIFVVSVEDKNLQFDGLYPYSYNYRGMYVELKYFREIL